MTNVLHTQALLLGTINLRPPVTTTVTDWASGQHAPDLNLRPLAATKGPPVDVTYFAESWPAVWWTYQRGIPVDTPATVYVPIGQELKSHARRHTHLTLIR